MGRSVLSEYDQLCRDAGVSLMNLELKPLGKPQAFHVRVTVRSQNGGTESVTSEQREESTIDWTTRPFREFLVDNRLIQISVQLGVRQIVIQKIFE
jgi:hypothetical protein